jgi:hypothetical protein
MAMTPAIRFIFSLIGYREAADNCVRFLTPALAQRVRIAALTAISGICSERAISRLDERCFTPSNTAFDLR